MKQYDLVVVGAGIVGLAHAYEATQRGLKVAVIEKNNRCVGASIRNFGFITVSGQSKKDTWRRARYSREVWKSICEQANIPVLHRGSWVVCQRPEAVDVAQAFLKSDMGADCRLFTPAEFSSLGDHGFQNTQFLNLDAAQGLFYSPYEFRVESREAIPILTEWLSSEHEVDFIWGTEVTDYDNTQVHTSQGSFLANKVVICPGGEMNGIAKQFISHHPITLCTLQMLRVRLDSNFRLPGSVMTDNSLARYLGWAELPEAIELKKIIENEMPDYIKEGIHLIAVQSADSSLVIGDSHRYGNAESVFSDEAIDEMIIGLLHKTLKYSDLRVIERWSGVYPSMSQQDALIEKVTNSLRVAIVTSGTGASTAFGLAKDNLDDWI